MNRIGTGRSGIHGRRFASFGLIAAFVCMSSGSAFAQPEEEDAGALDWFLDHYDPNPYDAYGFEYPYIADSPPEGKYHQPHDWPWKSDHQLKADVRNQLAWSPFVDKQDIQVSVKEGAVTLKGTVEDQDEIRDAIADAYEAGAKKVISRLHPKWADE